MNLIKSKNISRTLCSHDVSTKTVCICITYFVNICKDDFYCPIFTHISHNSQLHSTNEKIRSDLTVVKNVNAKLEERIISLEESQAKSEQYSRRNSTELSGIPNDIPEDNLEKVVIDICYDSDLEIEPKDIEGCHCSPASRYSRDPNKRVIVKFVNRKLTEANAKKQKVH